MVSLPASRYLPPMKRLIPIAAAFAVVAVLVSIKVRSRMGTDTPESEGTWELADTADTRDSDGAPDAS